MLSTPVPDEADDAAIADRGVPRARSRQRLVPPFFFPVRGAAQSPRIMRMARLTREIGSAQGRDPDKLEKQAGALRRCAADRGCDLRAPNGQHDPPDRTGADRGAGSASALLNAAEGGRLCRALADGVDGARCGIPARGGSASRRRRR